MAKATATQLQYSQNLLQNADLVWQLVNMSSLCSDDTVIEIGPGEGIITEALAKRCKKVIAVEIDQKFIVKLKKRFEKTANIKITNGDFLKHDLPSGDYKVFSNIPFGITADIMRKLFDCSNPPIDSYLIVQRQVAEKYRGAQVETLMSILHKPFFEFTLLYDFSRSDFAPTARVDCSLMRIKQLTCPMVEMADVDLFRDFVCLGFSGVKPTIKKTFEKVFSHVQFLRLTSDLGFQPDAKPSELSLGQWIGMFEFFKANTATFRKQGISGNFNKYICLQNK